MKKLLIILTVILFAGCEEYSGKCWECEIKYLDLKTNKLLAVDDTLKLCDKTREEVEKLEMNGEFIVEGYGKVRKLEYCELVK